MDAGSFSEQLARLAMVNLRDASRLMETSPGRQQPLADIPRNRHCSARLSFRLGFHARRTSSNNGTSVQSFLGVSDARLLRTYKPVRTARGFHSPSRPAA